MNRLILRPQVAKMGKVAIVILFMIIYKPIISQRSVNIKLLYSEPQLSIVTKDGEFDSITIHVKEPLKPSITYSQPDLGYETNVNLTVDEYCPIQVCKINKCVELFIDSEEMQILIAPNNFAESRPINSPQSIEWQSALNELGTIVDSRLDSLAELLAVEPNLEIDQIAAFYKRTEKLYVPVAKKWIANNKSSEVGWNLFIRNPRIFEWGDFEEYIAGFSLKLKQPSIDLVKSRLDRLDTSSRQKEVPDHIFYNRD